MKVTFLGTKGFIESDNEAHKGHSATLFESGADKLLVDCGQSWAESDILEIHKPKWVLITHAHPDHCNGLTDKKGPKFYGNPDTVERLKDKIKGIKSIPYDKSLKLGAFNVTPVKIFHSIEDPANGYIIDVDDRLVGLFTDVAWIPKYLEILKGLDLYIGDCSTLEKSTIRKTDDSDIYGHASVKDQLKWLNKAGVDKAIFTHLGTEPLEMTDEELTNKIKEMADAAGYKFLVLRVAKDGDMYEVV
jgi:ribonuclease BN (tRNA processing enzyme)